MISDDLNLGMGMGIIAISILIKSAFFYFQVSAVHFPQPAIQLP